MRSALLGPSGADPGEESLLEESLSSELPFLSSLSSASAMSLAAFLPAFRASLTDFSSSSLVSLELEDDELSGGSFFLLGSFFLSLRPVDVAFAAMPLVW